MGPGINKKAPREQRESPKGRTFVSPARQQDRAQPAAVTLPGLERKAPESLGFRHSY